MLKKNIRICFTLAQIRWKIINKRNAKFAKELTVINQIWLIDWSADFLFNNIKTWIHFYIGIYYNNM